MELVWDYINKKTPQFRGEKYREKGFICIKKGRKKRKASNVKNTVYFMAMKFC